MTLDKILRMPNEKRSLEYIEDILDDYKDKDERFFVLSFKKAIINVSFKKIDETIVFLEKTLENQLSEHTIDLYTLLIELLLEKKLTDYALNYIDIKKKILSIDDYKLHFFDMLKYYDTINDKSKAKKVINELLGAFINNDEKIFCYTILVKYARLEKNILEYNKMFTILCGLYEDKSDKTNLFDVIIESNQFDYNQGDYIKLINEANELLLNNDLLVIQKVKLTILLIKTYNQLNNYKAAAKIDSKYASLADLVDDNLKLEYFKSAYETYDASNNIKMFKMYHDKINNLRFDSTSEKEDAKQENSIKLDVVEETIIDEVKESTKTSNILLDTKEFKTVTVSKVYERINNILMEVNLLETSMFREVLRITLIELTKLIPINDIVVLYKQQNSFKGFHYKTQRVYDKTFDIKNIKETINYKIYLSNEVMYINDLFDKNLDTDIINNKKLEKDTCCFCLPFYKNEETIGSIAYFSDKDFLSNDMNFEIISYISNILNNHFNFFLERDEIKMKNQKLSFITENMSSGIKEFSEGYINLNHKAQEIFGLAENIYEKDFLEIIDPLERSSYVSSIKSLISGQVDSKEIEYHVLLNHAKVRIKERMYMNFSHNKVSVFSLIDNIDNVRQKEEALTRLAFTNYVSKLSSGVKLHKDLKDVIETKKFAIALINVKDFNRFNEMYGLEFTDNLMYHIASTLKELIDNNEDINLYHVEKDKFALLYLKTNDKRYLESNTLRLLENVSTELVKLDSKYTLTFCCGVFRSSSTYCSNKIEKILTNANDALYESITEDSNKTNVVIYNPDQTKERFFNTQLINHLSDAIESSMIAVDYNQVINLYNGDVCMYEVSINVTNYNVDLNALEDTFEKRSIKKQLSKYVINKVLLELSSFYTHTSKYFKVVIPIYASLLKDEEFINYVIGQKIFHNINESDVITLRIIEDQVLTINDVKLVKKLGVKLGSDSLNNFLLDLNDTFFFDINNYQNSSMKFLNVISSNKEDIIFYNVDNESLVNLCLTNNIKYAKGKYFSKKFNISDIINLVK